MLELPVQTYLLHRASPAVRIARDSNASKGTIATSNQGCRRA